MSRGQAAVAREKTLAQALSRVTQNLKTVAANLTKYRARPKIRAQIMARRATLLSTRSKVIAARSSAITQANAAHKIVVMVQTNNALRRKQLAALQSQAQSLSRFPGSRGIGMIPGQVSPATTFLGARRQAMLTPGPTIIGSLSLKSTGMISQHGRIGNN